MAWVTPNLLQMNGLKYIRLQPVRYYWRPSYCQNALYINWLLTEGITRLLEYDQPYLRLVSGPLCNTVVEGKIQFHTSIFGDKAPNYQLKYIGIKRDSPFVFAADYRSRVKAIRNPVLFLGPNESEYGSIAWDLRIEMIERKHNHRTCTLIMPEGGRILAIEDWDAGIDELKVRHRYERLHESNTSMERHNFHINHDKEFVRPDTDDMMYKILGVVHREIDIDIHRSNRAFNRRQVGMDRLPILYKSRVSHWTPTNPNHTRPPMPPEFPLIQYETNGVISYVKHKGIIEYYCIKMNTNEKGRVVDDCLTRINEQGQVFYYKKAEKPIFHDIFECVKQDNAVTKLLNQFECDGSNGYVGIDGWVYHKRHDFPSIGKIESYYYTPYQPNN